MKMEEIEKEARIYADAAVEWWLEYGDDDRITVAEIYNDAYADNLERLIAENHED